MPPEFDEPHEQLAIFAPLFAAYWSAAAAKSMRT